MEVTLKKWQARLTVEKVQNIKDGIAAVASCRVENWGKAQKIEDILKNIQRNDVSNSFKFCIPHTFNYSATYAWQR